MSDASRPQMEMKMEIAIPTRAWSSLLAYQVEEGRREKETEKREGGRQKTRVHEEMK